MNALRRHRFESALKKSSAHRLGRLHLDFVFATRGYDLAMYIPSQDDAVKSRIVDEAMAVLDETLDTLNARDELFLASDRAKLTAKIARLRQALKVVHDGLTPNDAGMILAMTEFSEPLRQRLNAMPQEAQTENHRAPDVLADIYRPLQTLLTETLYWEEQLSIVQDQVRRRESAKTSAREKNRNAVLEKAVSRIWDIWERNLGKAPTLSTVGGKMVGPFKDFLDCLFHPFGPPHKRKRSLPLQIDAAKKRKWRHLRA